MAFFSSMSCTGLPFCFPKSYSTTTRITFAVIRREKGSLMNIVHPR